MYGTVEHLVAAQRQRVAFGRLKAEVVGALTVQTAARSDARIVARRVIG